MSNEKTRGKFIVLEGVDGAGKSTQARLLNSYLLRKGIEVVTTREPGGTKTAEKIRGLFADTYGDHVDNQAELLLMFAARQIHLDNVIRPALEAGKWVVCDRFINSTYAYQVATAPEDEQESLTELMVMLTLKVVGSTLPDITITLDVPDTVGDERSRAARPDGLARWDEASQEKKMKINTAIRVLSAMPRNYPIDGNQPQLDVANAIEALIEDMYPELKELSE